MRRQLLLMSIGSLVGFASLPESIILHAQAQQPVQFQEQERAPMANAVGRFFGFGYSAGYHARTESRFGVHRYAPDHNVVPQPQRGVPAYPVNYGQNGQANYGMPGQVMPGQMMSGQMSGSTHSILAAPAGSYSMPMQGSSGQAIENLVPAPKPVEPPPSWLKQYMKPGSSQPGSAPSNSNQPGSEDADSLLDESSPSDRRGVFLPPSPNDSTTSLSITPMQPPVQVGGRPVISILQH